MARRMRRRLGCCSWWRSSRLLLWACSRWSRRRRAPGQIQKKIDASRARSAAQGPRAGADDGHRAPRRTGSTRCSPTSPSCRRGRLRIESDLQRQARRARPHPGRPAPERRGWSGCARGSRRARVPLAKRLVELYKADTPDIVTVVLEADGFADLLERTEFMQRVSAQDARIIDARHDAKADGDRDRAAARHAREAPQKIAQPISAAATRSSRVKGSSSTARQLPVGARRQGARAARPRATAATRSRTTSPRCGRSRRRSRRSSRGCERRPLPAGPIQPRLGRPDLAGQRADHLAVLRVARVGGLPPRHRHRRPDRHADPRRRGGPRRLIAGWARRLRQLHLHPAQRRAVHLLRAPVSIRRLGRASTSARARSSARPAAPAAAPARTCTSRCGSTAPS